MAQRAAETTPSRTGRSMADRSSQSLGVLLAWHCLPQGVAEAGMHICVWHGVLEGVSSWEEVSCYFLSSFYWVSAQ